MGKKKQTRADRLDGSSRFSSEASCAEESPHDVDEEESRASQSSSSRSTPSLLMNYCVIIGAIVVILAGINCARSVLGPFLMASFFAVLMISPVNWLRARGIASWLSLTVVIIGVLLVGVVVATLLGSQIAQFARDIPEYRRQFNAVLENYNLELGDIVPFLKDEKSNSDDEVEIAQTEENLASREELSKVGANAESKVKKSLESGGKESSEGSSKALVSSASLNGGLIDGRSSEKSDVKSDQSILDALSPALVALVEDRSVMDDLGFNLTKEPRLFPETPSLIQQSGSLDPFDDDSAVGYASEDPVLSGANVRRQAINAVNVSSQQLFIFLRGLAGQVSYFASSAFIVTLLVVFMLIETAKIPKKLVAALGEREFTNTRILNVIEDIRNYMAIKTEMSVIVGMAVTILLILSDVQYPLLWGFVAFFLNFIPNIGSVVAAVPPVVLATIEHGLVTGLVDVFFFGLINCVVGYVLEPRLLGKGLDLSPLVVLISLIFFGWLLGPVGMFLSPPLAVITKIVCQSFPETRWIAALMSNSAPETPADEGESNSSEPKNVEAA